MLYEDKMQVPCGRCEACLERLRLSWFVRLREEQFASKSAYFVTLTYSEEYVPFHFDDTYGFCYNFDKFQVQKFLKRFRKYDGSNKVRYFLISEYGGSTYRPHYHIHLFNAAGSKEQVWYNLQRAWPFGGVNIGDSTDASINYVAGHVQFRDSIPPGYERPFTLMSRKPGIGACGLNNIFQSYNSRDVFRLYPLSNGKYVSMPRYYQDRLYTKRSNDIRNMKLQSKSTYDPYFNEHVFEFKRKVAKRRKLRIDKAPI